MPAIGTDGDFHPRFIIVRGSPGIGKSTISSKIVSLNSAKKKSHLIIDNFQLLDGRAPCKDKEKLAIRNAALIAKNMLLEGFDVVAEYVFDDLEDLEYFTSKVSEAAPKVEFYLQRFYLDAPLEKVIKRNQSRSGKRGEYMNAPLLRKLYGAVSKTRGAVDGEIVFDTTLYSAKQSAKYILSYVEAFRNGTERVTMTLPAKDMERSLELNSPSDLVRP